MNLSRREFSKSLFLAGLGCAASQWPAGNIKAAEPNIKAGTGIIDVHTHIGTYTDPKKNLSPEALLSWMDEHQIEKSVVLPLTSPEINQVFTDHRIGSGSRQGVSGSLDSVLFC